MNKSPTWRQRLRKRAIRYAGAEAKHALGTGGIQGTHDTGDGVPAGMPNWKMGTNVMHQASLVRDYNIPGIAHQWASRVVHHLPKSM